MNIPSAQATVPVQKYDHYTVKELKQLIKDRNVLTASCTKKADYIKALEENDSYTKSSDDFVKCIDSMAQDVNMIKEIKEKQNSTIDLAKSTIEKLKLKKEKTNEDYETIIALYDNVVKLMSMETFTL